jgi:hypothetical protein
MLDLSTTCFLPPTPTTPERNLAFYAARVDQAGREGADIVCLGETINYRIHRAKTPMLQPGDTARYLHQLCTRRKRKRQASR